jgi:hypothetical protein
VLLGPREKGRGDPEGSAHNEDGEQASPVGSGEIVDEDVPF